MFVPIEREQRRADDESGDRAEQSAQRVLAGVERVRAQHRERAEHDPERVLHAGRSATSTASPSPTAPRTLLCSQTECRSTWAPARSWAAASALASPRGWRPSSALPASCDARPPRSDRCCAPIWETAKLSSCARKLGSSEVMNSLAPAPSASAPARRRRRGASSSAAPPRRRRAAATSRSACSSARQRDASAQLAAARVEQLGAALEHRGGSRLDGAGRAVAGSRPPGAATATTIAFSQLSSSTRRTIVRAAVLRPVGR